MNWPTPSTPSTCRYANEHLKAAAERADEDRARATGRWLVRYATDRCSATVGLALSRRQWNTRRLPADPDDRVALPPLRPPGGARPGEAARQGPRPLLWLAERVTGWGRVYALEALCRLDDPAARPWLLRRACDGDFLNGYFAGKVAGAARLHEALGSLGTDSETFDHTGRLLHAMSDCGEWGSLSPATPFREGPGGPRPPRGLLQPDPRALLHPGAARPPPDHRVPGEAGCSAAQQRGPAGERYVSVLDQEEWVRTARAGLAEEDHRMLWLAEYRVPQLGCARVSRPAPAAGAQHTRQQIGADQ